MCWNMFEVHDKDTRTMSHVTNNNTKMFNYQVCLQKIKIQRRNFIFYLKIPIFSFENVKIKLREPYDFLNNIS